MPLLLFCIALGELITDSANGEYVSGISRVFFNFLSELADVNIDTARFLPSGGGYESPDYSTALNRIELRIKGGVANFKVR